jgi:hypothetical protein
MVLTHIHSMQHNIMLLLMLEKTRENTNLTMFMGDINRHDMSGL